MSIPNLPDNLSKFFLIIGILMMVYGYSEYNNNINSWNGLVDQRLDLIDSVRIDSMILDHKREEVVDQSGYIAIKHNLPNPVVKKGSHLELEYDSSSVSNTTLKAYDTIQRIFHNYSEDIFYSIPKYIQWTTRLKYINEKFDENNEQRSLFYVMIFGGALIIGLGMAGYSIFNNKQNDLLDRQLNEKPKYFEFCQSCGKKFDSIIKHGNEKNGILNTAFCSDCYRDGFFTEPDLSINEIIERTNISINTYSNSWRKRIIKRIKKLERWRTRRY